MGTDRFVCPSSALMLADLLKQGRKALLLGLGLAIGAHVCLAQIKGSGEEEKAIKPLTTQFIKRQPRLSKPLELKKRPRPRHRQTQRKMIAVEARTRHRGITSSIQTSQVVSSLTRPSVRVRRSVYFERPGVEPEVLAEVIEGAREPHDRIDMSLEMVDIDALDTGQYHAMVVQDPTDKRNIRGFFHFARAYSVTMRTGEVAINWQVEDRINYGLMMIVEAMNKYTQIKSDLIGTIPLDSPELLRTPWVYATSYYSFSVTESEATNVGRYLASGGFLFTDAGGRRVPLENSMRDMIRRSLATQGLEEDRDWSYERVPRIHPILHCYFDFDSVPPGEDSGTWVPTERRPNYMHGVTINGRLLLILCYKHYVFTWGDWGRKIELTRNVWDRDNTRQIQFGINTIVFALIQEGSITHRLMDAIE